MGVASWASIIGVLLIVVALSDTMLSRLPLSVSMLYLLAGVLGSPVGLGLTRFTLSEHAGGLELLAEGLILISLFTSGLKMSAGLSDGRWWATVRLATLSMLMTVVAVAAFSVWVVGLSIGAAVLLGGILAPTDPVLASEVQVNGAEDRDRLRFALTGEAGLNDGTAYPVVALGMALLGLERLGSHGWLGFGLEVVWGVVAGVGIGIALGAAIGTLVLYLRRTHHEAIGLDNFLALGLVGVTYGVSTLAHGYGFLAVFVAGAALRRVERRATDAASSTSRTVVDPRTATPEKLATHPKHGPSFMARAILLFDEQLERIGELAVVVLIGMLLWAVSWESASWALVAALLLVIRPVSVALGLAGSNTRPAQRVMVGWFGIRGVGSFYYLTYAMNRGLEPALAEQLIALTLSVVVTSMVVHGISVTPLMKLYEGHKRAR